MGNDRYIDEKARELRNSLLNVGIEVTPAEVQEALDRMFLDMEDSDCERCMETSFGLCMKCFIRELLGDERFEEWRKGWLGEEREEIREELPERDEEDCG